MFFVHISIIRWDDNHLLFDVVMRVKTTRTPHLDNTTSTDLENPAKKNMRRVRRHLASHTPKAVWSRRLRVTLMSQKKR